MMHSAGATMEAKKYKYSKIFNRDPFIATSKELSSLSQNNLTEDSHPAEWFFSQMLKEKKSYHPANIATM